MKNDHHTAIEINGLMIPNHYSKNTELHEVESEEEFSSTNSQLLHTDQDDTELYVLVEKIKTAVHQLIYLSDKLPQQKTSNYISIKVNREYTYLNKLFKCITGISIKKYINNQKMELVKEILIYDKTDLCVIARKNYTFEVFQNWKENLLRKQGYLRLFTNYFEKPVLANPKMCELCKFFQKLCKLCCVTSLYIYTDNIYGSLNVNQ
jgi:AraC-like DNA-binding protein